jgi:hypothetical protein
VPVERAVHRPRRAAVLVVTALACTTLGAATCSRGTTRRVPVSLPRNGAFTMPDRAQCEDDVKAAVDVAAVDVDATPALKEVSGLAASHGNPDLLWMVADRGNPATVVGVAADDARVVVEVRLPVDNVDWEDVAVGPCPDLSGPCVFVADTGDNDGERDTVIVHAFPEPVLPALSSSWSSSLPSSTRARLTLDAVWTMPLAFPDDARGADVEAMVVFPDATAIVLFEKTRDDVARIWTYRAPWTPLSPGDGDAQNDAPRLLEQTGTVAVPAGVFAGVDAGRADPANVDDGRARRITGASLHWSGHRLLLRTTGGVLEYAADDASAFLDLSSRAPRAVWSSPPGEEQGEAIGYDAPGTGVHTIAEASGDDAPVLHHAACAGAVTTPVGDIAPVTTSPLPQSFVPTR